MEIYKGLREDLKTAMKEKDEVALRVIRAVLTLATNELVSQKRKPDEELSDEDILKLFKRSAKQRKDSISQFEAGGRDDLAATEKAELAIIEKYLPAQMSKEEIQKIAEQKKTELDINDKSKMGILMGAVMKEVGESADGADVKEVIESLLA